MKDVAMWNWDQGHLPYFQFDALRQIARFVSGNNFKSADKSTLYTQTGLSFKSPDTHSPWRNYSRALKLCFLISENNGEAEATKVAHILAQAGTVTCDEYLHFLVSAFTDPSPALENWQPNASFRYPLLFALKYLLTKTAVLGIPVADTDEIIGAYLTTGSKGDEDASYFINILKDTSLYESRGKNVKDNLRRQSSESLKVISQISYLHMDKRQITVSLDPADAHMIFEDLTSNNRTSCYE